MIIIIWFDHVEMISNDDYDTNGIITMVIDMDDDKNGIFIYWG